MYGFSRDCRCQSVPRQGSKVFGFRGFDSGSFRILYDRFSERVLAVCLQRIGKLQQAFLRKAVRGQNVRHFRLARGDRSGLIKRDDLHFAGGFQCFAGLEEDAGLCAHAVPDHDGDRCCQAERTGAGNNEHGDRARQRKADGLPRDQPADHHNDGDADDGRNEDAGYLIGDPGDRRFRRGGIRDHVDDLAERRVFPDAGRSRGDVAGLVDGRSTDLIAFGFVDRDGFACQCGFVDGRMSGQDDAIDRDGFAGLYGEDIAGNDFFDADLGLFAVPQQYGGLRRKLHQALERIGGAAFGHRFQHLSDGDQRRDHGGGFEVQLSVIKFHQLHIGGAFRNHTTHFIEYKGAPAEGDGRAERDQRIHIRCAVAQ